MRNPGDWARAPKAAPLADGIERQPPMASDNPAGPVHDVTGRKAFRPPAVQKRGQTVGRDKTDVLAVRFFRNGQPGPPGEFSHLRLAVLRQGEKDPTKLLLSHGVEKIGLILFFVPGFAQEGVSSGVLHPGIVTRGQAIETQGAYLVQEASKLQGTVALHAGVGGSPLEVGTDEGLDDHAVQFVCKIEDIVRNCQLLADPAGILNLLGTAAFAAFPLRNGNAQAHGDADNVVTLLLQKPGGGGGIHAAAQGQGDLFAHHPSRRLFR